MSRFLGAIAKAAHIAVFFLGLILLLGYFWVSGTFEHATIDVMFIYLTLPLTGVDKRYFVQFLLYVALAALLLLLGALRLRSAVAGGRARWLRRRGVRILSAVVSAGVLVLALGLWEARYGVYGFFFPDTRFYTYFEDRAAVVDADEVAFEGARRNLILIIVESMESVVNDAAVFNPPLMPAAQALERENSAFSGHRETVGVQGSISSFFAMMTGVPLVSSSHLRVWGNTEAEDEPEFVKTGVLPAQHDLQKKSHFFKAGRAEDLEGRTGNWNDDGHNWGVYDSYLYARSRDVLAEAAAAGEPFVHIIQTVDTHLPGFYEPGMPAPHGDIRDSFRQADVLLKDHLDWIRAQSFFEDTVVVVAGDHLLALSEVGGIALPPVEGRGIAVVFLNAAQTAPPRGTRRLFGTWDVAPTILEAMGARLPGNRLGLGTSLFADRETLFEKEGVAFHEEMIRKRSRLYNRLYRWF